MAKFVVTSTYTNFAEEVCCANSFEEAEEWWKHHGTGDELYTIENTETGEIIEYA